VFYVAVEGEVTEPDYLDYLNHEFGDAHGFIIHSLSEANGMKPRRVVRKALQHRDELDQPGEQAENTRRVQLWALFDRDQHIDIPEAMREATAGGVRVAFSHPSFDLWLLLHFVGVPDRQSGSSRLVHERLRRQPAFEAFAKSHDKGVTVRRVDALRGKHEAAATRARKLVEDCPTDGCSAVHGHATRCDPLQRDPSTDVWRLLVALGVVSS
jgi:hypothetical protein